MEEARGFGGDEVDRMLEEQAEKRGRRDRGPPRARGHSRSRSRRRGRRGRSPSFGRDVGVTLDLREKVDLERDEKTVFVCQIHPKSNEKDLFLFFSRVGKVIDIQLMRDNRTLKSKGLAYVEFDDVSCVWSAIRLSGQQLGGFPIKVQLTQAEKNRAARETRQTGGPPSPSSRPNRTSTTTTTTNQRSTFPMNGHSNDTRVKLYVSNIPLRLKEDDLRPMFGALGEVASLEIKMDRHGSSQGYGFVEYTKESSALDAIAQMNGLEIMNQQLKVVPAEQGSHLSMAAAAASAARGPSSNGEVASQSSATEILQQLQLGRGADGSDPSVRKDESLLHLDGNGGIILSSQAKLSLMQRLAAAGSEGQSSTMPMPADVGDDGSLPSVRHALNAAAARSAASTDPRSTNIAGVSSSASSSAAVSGDANARGSEEEHRTHRTEFGRLSRCLLLRNLFDPHKEKNPDFDREIHEDVTIEASKYGNVKHVFVDRTSQDGLVYLKLASTSEALEVAGKLHRRSFGESRIHASFYDETRYNNQFKLKNDSS